MTPTSRFLTPALIALLLSACQAAPAPIAGFPGGAPRAGKGRLAIVPTVAGAPSRRLLSVITPFSEADIDYIKFELFKFGQTVTPEAEAFADYEHLYDTVVFNNLEPNQTYTVRATAYWNQNNTQSISYENQSEVTLTVTDDDRPVLGNLVVTLIDQNFAGQARTSGLTVQPGGLTAPSIGFIGKTAPVAFDRAAVVVEDATLDYGTGVAIAADGTIYLASKNSGKIFVKPPSGPLTVFAGRDLVALEPPASRNGDAATATFYEPQALALGPDGTLYVADKAAIRQVAADGTVTTLAGHPTDTGYHDAEARFAETGADARFNAPMGLAVTPAGDVIVADTSNNCLRKVSAAGYVATVTSMPAFGVAIDRKGDYVVTGNNDLRRCTPAGVVSTLATGFTEAHGVVMDFSGHFYVADVWTVVRVAPDGTRQTVAGLQNVGLETGPDVAIGDARFSDVRGIARNADGEVFVTESIRNKLWKLFQLVGGA